MRSDINLRGWANIDLLYVNQVILYPRETTTRFPDQILGMYVLGIAYSCLTKGYRGRGVPLLAK